MKSAEHQERVQDEKYTPVLQRNPPEWNRSGVSRSGGLRRISGKIPDMLAYSERKLEYLEILIVN